MSINPADLTPAELTIYCAGYGDALDERASLNARVEQEADEAQTEIRELKAALDQANADADRYYRIAFNPRPLPIDVRTYAELEQIRTEMYASNAEAEILPWPDTATRHPANFHARNAS